MKKVLMLGVALSLLGGYALADSPAADSDRPRITIAEAGSDSGDRDWRGPRGDWRHDRHGWGDDLGPRGVGAPGPRAGFGPPPSRGAHIVLEHMGNRIDVKCADNDSTEQCVAAVEGLMEKIANAMQRHRPDMPPPPPAGEPRMPDQPAE